MELEALAISVPIRGLFNLTQNIPLLLLDDFGAE